MQKFTNLWTNEKREWGEITIQRKSSCKNQH